MPGVPEPASRNYASVLTDSTRWQAFVPRAGDIVVCTPPKSGTTWTQAILALLIAGDSQVDAQTSMKSPWIDINSRDRAEVMERLEAQEHRRQVKTHTPLDGIPVWPGLRYITVYRHPIDVYFSFRKHAANTTGTREREYIPAEYFSGDPSEGFQVYLRGDRGGAVSLEGVAHHYRCALERGSQANLLRLHYADMQRDLDAAFARIAAHVGISHPPALAAELVGAATFSSMKDNAHRFAPSAGQGNWHSDAGFFDSATSGKWLGVLSEADLADYDARISGLLDPAERAWLERGGAGG